ELARLERELAALRHATDGMGLDFVHVQSSVVPAWGGAGAAGAAAAYALVDAWAQRAAAEGARWTSVGWDRWRVEGAGEDAEAISPAEGARAFGRVAALGGEPRVIVSHRDPANPTAKPAARPRDGAEETAQHPRPELRNDYHPPTSPAEERLVGVWRELFGLREVGVRDNFFQLGGHSLLGMQVITRIREMFDVELPLAAIFEAPTIAGLAEIVGEVIMAELDEMSDEEALDQLESSAGADASPHLLLASLDGLSDEELDRLLAGEAESGRVA
ncbi:MAG TPA: phosphopantetheine-binding protein, partial [Longimicrobium sp.]|nr:phosphopantetheine-binding protein [Longimicrobium sp.]